MTKVALGVVAALVFWAVVVVLIMGDRGAKVSWKGLTTGVASSDCVLLAISRVPGVRSPHREHLPADVVRNTLSGTRDIPARTVVSFETVEGEGAFVLQDASNSAGASFEFAIFRIGSDADPEVMEIRLAQVYRATIDRCAGFPSESQLDKERGP